MTKLEAFIFVAEKFPFHPGQGYLKAYAGYDVNS